MSPQPDGDDELTVDQRDLPAAWHAKALLATAAVLAVVALLAMRYFL